MACSILIVDQEPETRAFLRTLLTAHGFVVHCAQGVEEGKSRCLSCCPDLMIVDALLPDEGAVSFCSCEPHVPVIYISPVPLGSLFFRNKLIHAHNGLDQTSGLPFIEKPLQEDELLNQINALVNTLVNTPGKNQKPGNSFTDTMEMGG